MNTTFTFTLIEKTEDCTEVLFSEKDKELIEYIFDSYDFEMVEINNRSFLINENIEDVYSDISDFEENTKELLIEEDDGFYVSPLTDIFEILYINDYSPIQEGTAQRTVSVRGGKRKIIFKCGPGQMKVGRSCRRIPTTRLNKMKRRARISARKARGKRRLANRKRKISLKRRAVLVKKKKSSDDKDDK